MNESFNEIISLIARERSIDETTVKEILKKIILEFAERQYGDDQNIKVDIHENGSFEIYIEKTVSEDNNDDDDFFKISLQEARARRSSAKVNEVIKEVLPFSIGISEVKKILYELRKRLTQEQKEKEYEVFYDKVHTVVLGYVKRIDLNEIIVSFTDNLGQNISEGEGVLRKNKTLSSDIIKPNTYIKVYIEDLKKGLDKQIILSRTHPNFLKELIKNEVPEVEMGLVDIKFIARDPGSLAKVAVHSNRSSIDPIKICVGDYGSRINAVKKELAGERVNFVLWSEDKPTFIKNALKPAEVIKVIQKSEKRFDVVVSSEDFSKAMGRGGVNVSLSKRICEASITILTEEEEHEKYKNKIETLASDLISNLQIEDMMAHLLISEKFETAEIIAKSEPSSIANLNGFDEELANILINRAKEFLVEERSQLKAQSKEMYGDNSLFEVEALSTNHIKCLLSSDIISKQDLAMLDAQELVDIFDKNDKTLEFDFACDIISNARGIKKMA